MSKLSDLTNRVAVANQSGAMEADTIKNGDSPKTQRSRRKYIFIAIVIMLFTLSMSVNIGNNENKSNKNTVNIEIIALYLPDSVIFKSVKPILINPLEVSLVSQTDTIRASEVGLYAEYLYSGKSVTVQRTITVPKTTGVQTTTTVPKISIAQKTINNSDNNSGTFVYFARKFNTPVDFKPQKIKILDKENVMFYDIVKAKWE